MSDDGGDDRVGTVGSPISIDTHTPVRVMIRTLVAAGLREGATKPWTLASAHAAATATAAH
jgi:hypothetical protein